MGCGTSASTMNASEATSAVDNAEVAGMVKPAHGTPLDSVAQGMPVPANVEEEAAARREEQQKQQQQQQQQQQTLAGSNGIVDVPKPLGVQLDLAQKDVQKSVQDIMLKPRKHWVGDGFHVFPVFDRKAFTREMTPFLMFDYAAPKHFEPTRNKLGVGKHPHRGFETVTIAWQGEVEHGDHLGNRDVIFPGDVQWMTAGRGIVHEEFHSREFAKRGGVFEMCQLWVNLPSEHKMTEPRYQPISSGAIPSIELPSGDGRVRVIAGDFFGIAGPSKTFTPIDMWEVVLDRSGAKTDLVFPPGHNTIIFIKRGAAVVGAKRKTLSSQDVALMGKGGRQIPVEAKEDGTALLILSGEPINEPIAARGPMVMNTQEELAKAMDDYSRGRNGFPARR